MLRWPHHSPIGRCEPISLPCWAIIHGFYIKSFRGLLVTSSTSWLRHISSTIRQFPYKEQKSTGQSRKFSLCTVSEIPPPIVCIENINKCVRLFDQRVRLRELPVMCFKASLQNKILDGVPIHICSPVFKRLRELYLASKCSNLHQPSSSYA